LAVKLFAFLGVLRALGGSTRALDAERREDRRAAFAYQNMRGVWEGQPPQAVAQKYDM